MKHLAGCRVSHFAELARLCSTDPGFPRTASEWSRLIAQADELAAHQGFIPEVCVIEPRAFEKWCALVEVVPCLDTLKAYAIVRRAQAAGKPISTYLRDVEQARQVS